MITPRSHSSFAFFDFLVAKSVFNFNVLGIQLVELDIFVYRILISEYISNMTIYLHLSVLFLIIMVLKNQQIVVFLIYIIQIILFISSSSLFAVYFRDTTNVI